MAGTIAAAKVPLIIEQGTEFRHPLWWAQPKRAYIPITGIAASAPAIITAPVAGVNPPGSTAMPDGWPFWIESVRGMTDINRPFPTEEAPDSEPYIATKRDANTIEINDLNALGFPAYSGSGVIIYQPPYDFTGATAKLQFRKSIADATVLKELSTVNGGIILDNTLKLIILFMSDVDTAALAWKSAVYDLEVKLSGAGTQRVAYGPVTVSPEVTR